MASLDWSGKGSLGGDMSDIRELVWLLVLSGWSVRERKISRRMPPF